MAAPPPPQADAAVLTAYQQQTQALRERLALQIAAIWWALGSWRDEDEPSFVKRVVPLVQSAQRQMSSLTVGYLTAFRTASVGRSQTTRVNPASVSGAAVRNGVDPAEVYGRPFHLVWRQLAELPKAPGSIDQAIQAGLDRAVQTAHTDVQLAKTHTSRQVVGADRYAIGYRRVLEGPHSCGLCIVASTNTYHKADLLPIHPACDCAVVPTYVDSDVADRANRKLLGDVHQAIADRFGSSDYAAQVIPGAKDGKGKPIDYRRVLVTHDHGELGPVLAVRGAPFTGPSDIKPKPKGKRPTTKPGRTPEQVRAELTALEKNLPRLTTDQQRNYTRQRIASLRKTLEGA